MQQPRWYRAGSMRPAGSFSTTTFKTAIRVLKDLYRQSPLSFALVIIAGLGAGMGGAGVVHTISKSVSIGASLRALAPQFFFFCLLQLLSKTGSQLLLMNLSQEVVCRLRIDLCRKVLLTPHRKLETLGKARLQAILTADITTVTQAAQVLPSVFGNGIVIAVCMGYIAWLSWLVFACFCALFVCGGSAYYFAERLPRQRMRQVREQLDIVYRHFRSLLEGSRELQLNAVRAKYFVDHVVSPSARHFRTLFLRGMGAYALVDNAGNTLFYLTIGLLLFVMPVWHSQPGSVMTTLTFLLLFLIQPITDVLTALPFISQSAVALARIRQLEADLIPGADASPELSANDPFAHADAAAPLLKFASVYHQFPCLSDDRPFMLGPVNLTIDAGELIFVVGGNGSGKTTLAMLLLGLYEPERGHIELNGVPVDQQNRAHYRQYFSAVFADFHLFDEMLGADQQDIENRATRYLDALGLTHKVKVESGRFTTTRLSTGQRKRMALVSSYLEDRPIYLFDEWAADQDPAFKRVFYRELLPELKSRGKTAIVISHDDAYFDCADRIVTLSEGTLTVAAPPLLSSRVDDRGFDQTGSA
jgi:putative pyoverdin transport system ATP-binding/permease protein